MRDLGVALDSRVGIAPSILKDVHPVQLEKRRDIQTSDEPCLATSNYPLLGFNLVNAQSQESIGMMGYMISLNFFNKRFGFIPVTNVPTMPFNRRADKNY